MGPELHYVVVIIQAINPKYFSKNVFSLSMIESFCFLLLAPLLPKREIGGMIESTSVPVVFNITSLKEF